MHGRQGELEDVSVEVRRACRRWWDDIMMCDKKVWIRYRSVQARVIR